MTSKGEEAIWSVCGKLLDNPGGLAWMLLVTCIKGFPCI